MQKRQVFKSEILDKRKTVSCCRNLICLLQVLLKFCEREKKKKKKQPFGCRHQKNNEN